jgi:hypothetical protein
MGAEDSDRLARLDQQGLVVFELAQAREDAVERGPVARRAADAAVDAPSSSGRSATSGSRLFCSMRYAASVSHDLQCSVLPSGARTDAAGALRAACARRRRAGQVSEGFMRSLDESGLDHFAQHA